ncbi:glycine cleavage system protein H [Caldimicrobium thiodismutans]|jgi:glycine cleavage system H protein|uniref:Glycine cleavage system protein H n=1 Tax=Caldimicrobium thiodismutans TaxID=1653476 RepID=A0A0U5B7N2_9BACT|nr:glycine cleavage system protein GcvH [Caldimicrobium thiodismutans]BAU24096.1 glycine cleavage system protein H [Caldimicrobium thiodismutans]
MRILEDRLYTENHLWVKKEKKKIVRVGITDFFSAKEIEIINVDLPEEGEEYEKDDVFGSIESIEEEFNLVMPVSGVIVSVNEKVLDDVDLLNEDPYEEGWLVKIEMANPSELEELLPAEDYELKIAEEFEEVVPEKVSEEEE